MRSWMLMFLAMSFLLVNSAELRAAEELILAKNGQANKQIVLDDNATPAEKTAASELRKYLDKITGGHFEIVEKASPDRGAIFVGQSAYVRKVCKDIDFDNLGTDGIVIRTVGRNLILSGDRPRGTLYAVYTFLQDYLGCRFYAPDEEKIPAEKNLSIKPIDFKYAPKLMYREYYSIGTYDPAFAAKSRLNGREFMNAIPDEYGGYVLMGGAHSLVNFFIKPADHFKEHPEWFAWREKEKKRSNSQLCLTNPAMRKQLLKELLEHLEKEYPNMPAGRKMISLSCNDDNLFCQCENCMKVVNRENTPAGPLVELLNFVSKGVREKYPDLYINTLAYWMTDMPPRTLKCEDNIIVQVGCLDRNHKLPVAKTRFANVIQGWKKSAKHIYIWDYDANFKNYIQPHPNRSVIDESLKYYCKNGVEGVFVQGAHGAGAEMYPLRAWVHSQMMWDANKDNRKLSREFCNAYYGPAGKYILQYVALTNRAINRYPGMFLGAYEDSTNKWLHLDDMNKATVLFSKALEAVEGDEKFTRRVRLAKLSLDIAWLQRYHELQQTAKKDGKKFLGPKDPYAEMDRLEKNEFGITTNGEGVPYSEYLKKLRKMFPKRTSSLPEKYREGVESGQWVEIQENLLAWKNLTTNVADDPNASDKKTLLAKGDSFNGAILYTVPEHLSGTWRVLVSCRTEPAAGYDSVDIPVVVYYRPYPGKAISETVRTYLNFTKKNSANYKIADLGVTPLGPGTEIQIQPNGVGHFGKAGAIFVDRILLIEN